MSCQIDSPRVEMPDLATDGGFLAADTQRPRNSAPVERRTMPATQSPRHPDFVTVVLEPMALRRMAGESADKLSLELYTALHTWAVAFSGAQCARLPGHADRSEVLSQVLRLTWDACLRIDWERYAAWPAYLESKVSRARAEAARSDDWLSRRERVRRRHFQGELARREQLEQRTLTAHERQAMADVSAPSSSRVDWGTALIASRHPSTVAEVPDIVETNTVEDQVEDQELGRIRSECLAKWMVLLAAQNTVLAAELSRWSQANESADRELPARLVQRLQPYTSLLLAMLGEAA
jgi:hypothetical protein